LQGQTSGVDQRAGRFVIKSPRRIQRKAKRKRRKSGNLKGTPTRAQRPRKRNKRGKTAGRKAEEITGRRAPNKSVLGIRKG